MPIDVPLVLSNNDEKYLVNLILMPERVEYSPALTAALHITDGVVVVVDCMEGVLTQTEMFARQILSEKIKPVLHVNKVDRGIREFQLTAEELYQKLNHNIEQFNSLVSNYDDESVGD